MTDQEINIAIAEALGHSVHEGLIGYLHQDANEECEFVYTGPLPDYCHDLDAMHEAERIFDDKPIDEQSKYLDYLYCEVGWHDSKNARDAKHKCYYGSVRATAHQRAGAFLRAVGKWKET